jgi:uncharacterized protein
LLIINYQLSNILAKREDFIQEMTTGYTFTGGSIVLGAAMLDGETQAGVQIKVPLRTMNRHGLIAGATGTGKTKSLQAIAEQLSSNGVACLLMDIKGDLSGIAMPGSENPKITDRCQKIGINWHAKGMTSEFLTLSQEKGARLRATVSEFGPVLFSRILGLNDTQGGVVAVVFKYCERLQKSITIPRKRRQRRNGSRIWSIQQHDRRHYLAQSYRIGTARWRSFLW